jgi:hypothetical protein
MSRLSGTSNVTLRRPVANIVEYYSRFGNKEVALTPVEGSTGDGGHILVTAILADLKQLREERLNV